MRHIRLLPPRRGSARLSRSARLLPAVLLAGCAPAVPGVAPGATSVAARALADADSSYLQQLAPGVLHLRAWDARGPWAIQVLEIDTARCVPRWSARKPRGPLAARALTSTLADSALAAINADFFQLPGGTPVGPHVSGGRVWIGPGDRPAWLASGRALFSGVARLAGHAHAGADTVALVQVNRAARASSGYRPPGRGAFLFTALAAAVPEADAAADVVFLRVTGGDEAAGRGTVLRVVSHADSSALEPGEAAVQLLGEDTAWARRRQPGDTVHWAARVVAAGPDPFVAVEAVGGFPELLRGGRAVLGEVPVLESFGAQRHPRTAIGWSTRTGRVFLVVVDGRQPPYSAGMSLAELLWLFQRLGASDALNLDGGGSSAFVIRGAVQNRPSDREGERAVGNALALADCATR